MVYNKNGSTTEIRRISTKIMEGEKTKYEQMGIAEREALVAQAEKDLEEANAVFQALKIPGNYESNPNTREHARKNIEYYAERLERLRADLEKARSGEQI